MIFFRFVPFCIFSCLQLYCMAQDAARVSRTFYATAGVGQLITVDQGTLRIPTASGGQITAGIGPLGRFYFEGQASIHRLLGVSQAVKNGYLKSYGVRLGVIPFKPVPIYFFAGLGIHVYDLTYQEIEAAGVTILPSFRSKKNMEYKVFGASYQIVKNCEVEFAYRVEPIWIEFKHLHRESATTYYSFISIGVNYWLNKYKKFPPFKRD
jgi:hypothetical protein